MNWTIRIKQRNTALGLVTFLCLFLLLFASPAYSTTIAFAPTVDGYVSSFSPNVNQPGVFDSNYLFVGTIATTPTSEYRTFLKFDISSLPDTSVITAAVMGVYLYNVDVSYDYVAYHVADDNAVVSSMSWSNQPAAGSTPLDTTTVSSSDTWVTFDLLSNPSLWDYVSDLGDNSVSLRLNNNALSSSLIRKADFYSSEYYHPEDWNYYDPYLFIDYSEVPLPGAVWLLGSGLIGLVGVRRRFKK
jgi:hypothetical protein